MKYYFKTNTRGTNSELFFQIKKILVTKLIVFQRKDKGKYLEEEFQKSRKFNRNRSIKSCQENFDFPLIKTRSLWLDIWRFSYSIYINRHPVIGRQLWVTSRYHIKSTNCTGCAYIIFCNKIYCSQHDKDFLEHWKYCNIPTSTKQFLSLKKVINYVGIYLCFIHSKIIMRTNTKLKEKIELKNQNLIILCNCSEMRWGSLSTKSYFKTSFVLI